ncbi:MAG TPA: STAS domain-containing protein [Gaiellaceae bacterium]|nr:STAS domain-containing protein [Gaiellaceae bacterium]HET8653351.1 STAS domain-containing protein [Gaiellaceae bacterium]
MEPGFEVKTAQLGPETFVVSVTGEADLHTAPEIEQELREVLRLGGRAAALDLVEVGFIDSTTLSLLLRFQPRFRARGGDLVIVSDDRRVLRTLEITGMDRIFRTERRLGDALAAMLADGVSANGTAVAAQSAPEPA